MEFDFRPKVAILVIALLLIGVFAAPTAMADELYGRVRGVVTDASGAVLPGVQLKLTDSATGIIEGGTSGPDGSFIFVNLKPGTYDLTASKASFKTFQSRGIVVSPNQIFVQNIQMELGTVSETLTVEANPAQVEQSSMQLTATISDKTITDLPLNGRNWVFLQQTLPGVVNSESRFTTAFSTNGSQAQQNSYLINGNDFNDLPLNTPLAPPNPDAIAEVKMVTNTINPEFGRNSGAIMNAVTKSGTNSFHGTAFEFYRDTFLNTKAYFQTKPSIFHQNQFGGTVGGPIWKNKMFFFYGLQLTRNRAPSPNTSGTGITVFTPAQLSGDFSTSTLSTKPIPATLTNINGPSGVCPGATTWAACFPTNQIPTSVFNPLSSALVAQFVPPPNVSATQFSWQPLSVGKTNQHIGRFDWTVGHNDSIWFYAYANNNATVDDAPFTGSTLPGFGQQSTAFTKQFTASWNHTFTTEILNEFRLGYTRLNFVAVEPQKAVQPSDVGFTNIFPQLSAGAGYPFMNVRGYFALGFSTNGPQPRKDQTYQITDNFSWIKGKHSFKFGYDGRRFQVWNPFSAVNNGSFQFRNTATYSTGDAGLDFLLGIPQTYTQNAGGLIIAQAYEHYLYAQDQWRVKDNLTITLGTGYQIDTPLEEFQFKGLSRVCFQPGVQSVIYPPAGGGFEDPSGTGTGAPIGYTFPGDPGCNKYGGAKTHYGHFGPRVGFAYSPNWGGQGKTSIRGGFGLYFNRSEEELNLQDLAVPPTGLNSFGVIDINGRPSFPDPWTDINGSGTLANKFPFVPPAAGSVVDFHEFTPVDISVLSPKFTTPYSMNFNLTVERELPAHTILRVGYVGALGRKLITSLGFNPTTPQGVADCLADPNNTFNGGTLGCADSPDSQPADFPSHYAFDTSAFGQSGIQTNGGWSNYNSFQVTVDKRLSHGLQMLTSYTWAHSLDVSSSFEDTAFQAAGGVDPYGRFRRDYGSSAFDARHRWVLSFSYDFPKPPVLPRVLGGWKITGINTLQTGFPVNLESTDEQSLTCSLTYFYYACPDRPDVVFRPKTLDPRNASFGLLQNYWFDPSAFTDPAIGTLGNARRGFLVGPGYWNTDFSIQKETMITEGKFVQLRLEAFNLFNHTNFRNPNGDVADPNFGRITQIVRNGNARLVQLGAKFIF